MKKLNFSLLLLFILIIPQESTAQQKQVFFDVSALAQLDNFPKPTAYAKNITRFPVVQTSLGYSNKLYHSNLKGEVIISYMQSSVSYEQSEFSIMPSPHPHPNYSFTETVNLIGLKTGFSRSWNSVKASQISIAIGGSLFYAQKNKTDSPSSSNMYIGLYAKPSYEIPVGGADSPWRLRIFAEMDCLWKGDTKIQNEIFLIGGGLGLSYFFE